jgi:glucose-1-phosphate adenylyltransferase
LITCTNATRPTGSAKNARVGEGARLVNDRGIQDVDGDGYYIRNGIIIVPKGGVVKPGTVV